MIQLSNDKLKMSQFSDEELKWRNCVIADLKEIRDRGTKFFLVLAFAGMLHAFVTFTLILKVFGKI